MSLSIKSLWCVVCLIAALASPMLNAGHFCFPSVLVDTASNDPYAICAAHFNHDTEIDLAVVNFLDQNVSVFLNQGGGALSKPYQTPVNGGPIAVLAADLDNDGDQDLVTANYVGNTVSVSFNDSYGGFTFDSAYAAGAAVWWVTSGDIENDGDIDLAVVSSLVNELNVLLNDGTGHFGPLTHWPVGQSPRAACGGDFNGDGLIDFATANYQGSDISILINLGDDQFAPAVSYPCGEGPWSIITAELEGDSDLDIAVANVDEDRIYVFAGLGDGTFKTATYYTVGNGPDGIAAADFDGDGRLDLGVANQVNNTVSILISSGGGSFAPADDFEVGSGPTSLIAPDLNSDGFADLATTLFYGNQIMLLFNTGNATFPHPSFHHDVGWAWRSPVVDVDSDRDLDIILEKWVPDYSSISIVLYRNTGLGEFTQQLIAGGFEDEVAVMACSDLDSDHDLDLAILLRDWNGDGGQLNLFEHTGSETYVLAREIPLALWPQGMCVGDFDRDGDDDIAVSLNSNSPFNCTIRIYHNDGNFLTHPVDFGPFPYYANEVSAGDLDGDSDFDLVAAISGGIAFFKNDGSGTLGPPAIYSHSLSLERIKLVDMDGNGYLDIVLSGYSSVKSIAVIKNDGAGNFPEALTTDVGRPTSSLATGDFDGDGDIDIAVDVNANNQIVIYANDGNGILTRERSYVQKAVCGVNSGDFDGDGNIDLVTDICEISNVSAISIMYNCEPLDYIFGDVDGDGQVGISDAVFLINYIFQGGPAPSPYPSGDLNRDQIVDISDAIAMINYIF